MKTKDEQIETQAETIIRLNKQVMDKQRYIEKLKHQRNTQQWIIDQMHKDAHAKKPLSRAMAEAEKLFEDTGE